MNVRRTNINEKNSHKMKNDEVTPAITIIITRVQLRTLKTKT